MPTRTLVTFCLCAAMAAFTYGCSSGGDGAAGSGGAGGTGGAGGGMGGTGGAAGIANDFETSLHNTRNGKDFWYNRDNNGMELLTNVAYDEFACQGCHNKSDPDVPDPYEPSCADCHGEGDKHLQPETCLGCHGRQRAELGMLQGMDFHSIAEFAP